MMKKLLLVMLALSALAGVAEETPKKIAVFVQNRTRVPGMDDEVDGIAKKACGVV